MNGFHYINWGRPIRSSPYFNHTMIALQDLIHPVEFPLCGTPFGGFHRAGFYHPNEEGGLFWAGGRALSFQQRIRGGNPAQSGKRAKLPRRYVAEKTSPRALELKKSPPSLRKYELCKALTMTRKAWAQG